MSNDPIEPMSVEEILADGVFDVKIIEQVVRIPWYVRRDGDSQIVVRIAVPASELPEVIQALVIALTEMVRAIVKPVSH